MLPAIPNRLLISLDNATVSVRLNQEGGMAPSFRQKVGIRRGCSLSPAIFVLILDYAMNAYMQACEELGIDAEAAWLGYADDLAINSTEVDKAEAAFHQLQAACAFVGLHCNITKTECMALGVTKPTATKDTACKERIQVTFENGRMAGGLDWQRKISPSRRMDRPGSYKFSSGTITFDNL